MRKRERERERERKKYTPAILGKFVEKKKIVYGYVLYIIIYIYIKKIFSRSIVTLSLRILQISFWKIFFLIWKVYLVYPYNTDRYKLKNIFLPIIITSKL